MPICRRSRNMSVLGMIKRQCVKAEIRTHERYDVIMTRMCVWLSIVGGGEAGNELWQGSKRECEEDQTVFTVLTTEGGLRKRGHSTQAVVHIV